MTEESPLVSVIVPTYNSADYLEVCLQSVRSQTYDRIELLVVDNGSSDRTKQIARQFCDRVFDKGPERSTQRNFGAEQADGDFLFFIDSDMELTETVVGDCVRAIPEYSGVIVPERSVGNTFWARCKALEKQCYVGDDDIEAPRFFPAELVHEFGGYDESIAGGGEDWDLPQRMENAGHDFTRVSSEIIHHEGDLSLEDTVRSKFYYGKTLDRYLKKHSGQATRQFSPIRPAFLRNWPLLLRHPVLATGMLGMKFCEYAAGAAGVMVSRLSRG